jgi:N-acetylmuramoyl-L-alanine amidase
MTAVPVLPKQTPRTETLPDPTKTKEKAAVALMAPKPAKLGDSQSLTRVLGLKVGRIVIDPGHGGHDTGSAGPGGLFEKELVLDVAKRIGALIESRMGAEVVYTREDDTFVALERRTAIANERGADLFLSIHANSSHARNASGVETYYLNFTSSKEALEVAARENASSQTTVHELKDLLQKIALQDKVDESREFAAKIQQALYSASARANARTRDRGVKKAPFVVLIGASMPSVLAEVGFISNPKDEALFKKPAFRQKIAEGIYKGLSLYAATLSQSQVAKN